MLQIFPLSEDTLALTVYPSDYAGKLVEYCTVKIYSQIRVKETKQTWSEEDDFILEKPQLKLEVTLIALRFTMPLKDHLSDLTQHVSRQRASNSA